MKAVEHRRTCIGDLKIHHFHLIRLFDYAVSKRDQQQRPLLNIKVKFLLFLPLIYINESYLGIGLRSHGLYFFLGLEIQQRNSSMTGD